MASEVGIHIHTHDFIDFFLGGEGGGSGDVEGGLRKKINTFKRTFKVKANLTKDTLIL